MSVKSILFTIIIIVLAIVIFVDWTAWNASQIGWAHVAGLGASVLILVLIWLWPGNWQPTKPPN